MPTTAETAHRAIAMTGWHAHRARLSCAAACCRGSSATSRRCTRPAASTACTACWRAASCSSSTCSRAGGLTSLTHTKWPASKGANNLAPCLFSNNCCRPPWSRQQQCVNMGQAASANKDAVVAAAKVKGAYSPPLGAPNPVRDRLTGLMMPWQAPRPPMGSVWPAQAGSPAASDLRHLCALADSEIQSKEDSVSTYPIKPASGPTT